MANLRSSQSLDLLNFIGPLEQLERQNSKILLQREKTVEFLAIEAKAQREKQKQNTRKLLKNQRAEIIKKRFEQFKQGETTSKNKITPNVLFPQVLPYLVAFIKKKDIVSCRGVCKQWRSDVQIFLENFEMKWQLRQHSHLTHPVTFRKLRNYTSICSQFLYRFHFPRRKSRMEEKVLKYKRNPFIGGNVVFVFDIDAENQFTEHVKTRVYRVLEKCGKFIKYLKLVSSENSTCLQIGGRDLYDLCQTILIYCPNLKHLSFSQMERATLETTYVCNKYRVYRGFRIFPEHSNLEALEFDEHFCYETQENFIRRFSDQIKFARLPRWKIEFAKLSWTNLQLLDVPDIGQNIVKLDADNLSELRLRFRPSNAKTDQILRKIVRQVIFYEKLETLQLQFTPGFVGFSSGQAVMGRPVRVTEDQQFCSGSLKTLVLYMCYEDNILSFDFLIYFPHLKRLDLKYENYQTEGDINLHAENVIFLNKFIHHSYSNELSIYRSNIWEVLPRLDYLLLKMSSVQRKTFSRRGYNNFKNSSFQLIPESAVTSARYSENLLETCSKGNKRVKYASKNELQPCTSRSLKNFQNIDMQSDQADILSLEQVAELDSYSLEGSCLILNQSEFPGEDNQSESSNGTSRLSYSNLSKKSNDNIFEEKKIRDKVLDEFVNENVYLSVTNLLICLKVTDSWLPYVINKLQDSSQPIFNFELSAENSLHDRQYVTSHGEILHQFFHLMELVSSANIPVPSFCLNLAPDFFREETHADLSKCLSTYGEGLVSLKLNFPVDGGSMMFLFPDRNLQNLKTFAVNITNSKSCVPDTQKVFGNNNNLFFLMQMILPNNIANFELHCDSDEPSNLIPFGFEHLALPDSINTVTFTFPLEPKILKIIIKSSLTNLQRLTFATPRNQEEVEVVFEILRKCSNSLQYFGLIEAINNTDQGKISNNLIRIPVMRKLAALEVPGYPVKIESQGLPFPVNLSALTALHFGNCKRELFASYLKPLTFSTVVNLSLSWNSNLEPSFQSEITEVVNSVSNSFVSLKELGIPVLSCDTKGMQNLFRKLSGLRRLNLTVLKTEDIHSSEKWDSMLLGIPEEMAKVLRVTKFREMIFVHDKTSSILNMTELEELLLETDEPRMDIGPEPLISEVVFYHGFFKMKKLSKLLLKGRFQIPEDSIQQWKRNDRAATFKSI